MTSYTILLYIILRLNVIYNSHYFYYLFYLCLLILCVIFFFKQKTAYEMRISDWSSDVCSSDLRHLQRPLARRPRPRPRGRGVPGARAPRRGARDRGARGLQPLQGVRGKLTGRCGEAARADRDRTEPQIGRAHV